jgi:hypothetical protein
VTFQLRLSCVEIFKICQDFSRFIEIYQHYWNFLRYFRLKNLNKLIDREIWLIKLTNSWSRSRQTVKICQTFQVLTDFLISIETFGTGRCVETKSRFLDLNQDFLIVETSFLKLSRFSRLSRLTFTSVEIGSLDRDHVKTNWDPQAYYFSVSWRKLWVPRSQPLKWNNFYFEMWTNLT